MGSNGEFFLDFMGPFFDGFIEMFQGIFGGIFKIFNVINYYDIIKKYSSQLEGFGWVIVVLMIVFLLFIFALVIFLIAKAIKKYIKYRRNYRRQDSLVEEIEDLNSDLIKLKNENEKYKNMADPDKSDIEYDEEGNVINKLKEGESRFFKLTKIDEDMKSYKPVAFNKTINLNQLCEAFRNFSANKLNLYYDIELIRLFIAAFSSNRLIILEGISGTGKTSLAYAFSKFIQNEAAIASVQPSWRDSTELFGYFNEFTKRFNETEVLRKMYEAKYKEDVFITLLDEMNISRVEYYFAEMLSVLELPRREEWIIELVPNVWDNDPIKLDSGKMLVPDNMWYIGTINNDDSTFMITDKVYDRAFPIAINRKFDHFDAPETSPIKIKGKYFESLFTKALREHPVSQDTLNKLKEMDDYIINHFRLAFGNRIMKQISEFVPVYVACGGTEIVALDYIIAHKILRKFDQLNLAYIRNEIDGFIKYLDELFGKDVMVECKDTMNELKKRI